MQDSRLVIFAHGSPDIRWRLPFEELTASLTERHGADKVRLAYMEFVRPSLADVVREAARDGKLHLRVLPFSWPLVLTLQKIFRSRSQTLRGLFRKSRSNSCSQSVSIIE